jgi:hypothetical protein
LLRCPWNDEDCRGGQFCQMSVWSTPKVPRNHADQLKRRVSACIHVKAKPPSGKP